MDPGVEPAREKLQAVAAELSQAFIERNAVVEGSLAALLAGQHVLLVGPPGTAKSMLADGVCRRIEGARYFQWLLTKFTTPEEVFGAVSLKALERDEYRRVTTNKLPEAHIAFLDEVFKASSSILNALLTLLNERCFDNGSERIQTPLITLFGAANELPEEDELSAVYDRFLVRFVVDYIEEDWRFLRMLGADEPHGGTMLSASDLATLAEAARAIEIPETVLGHIVELRRDLGEKEVVASDRRYRQSLGLLRGLALLRGHDVVGDEEVLFLEHVLWNDPAEREVVREALRKLVHGHDEEVQELLFQALELKEYAGRGWKSMDEQTQAIIEVETKLRRILVRLDDLERDATAAGREVPRAVQARAEIDAIRRGLGGT
ncbi:MAG: AAA family ATPase [Candidatus Binatia bacterium]|nr:AAA family ATPase [Candidatus Binatia bacterium]